MEDMFHYAMYGSKLLGELVEPTLPRFGIPDLDKSVSHLLGILRDARFHNTPRTFQPQAPSCSRGCYRCGWHSRTTVSSACSRNEGEVLDLGDAKSECH